MSDYPKSIKRLMAQYLGKAYERELERELARLERSFVEWRSGRISSRELRDRLYEFEIGPARALAARYDDGQRDMTLAYLIAGGILDYDEVPDELLQALHRQLAFYEMLKERDDLRAPEDLSRH